MRRTKLAIGQNLLIVLGFLMIIVGIWGTYMSTRESDHITPTATEVVDIGPIFIGNESKLPAQIQTNLQSPMEKDIHNVGIQEDPAVLNFEVIDEKDKGIETPSIPDRIEIPAIKLDAPVVSADYNFTQVQGETFGQWTAPSMFAAGWHPNSALLGKKGNTVINGHHNEYGEVFGKLVDLNVGDIIYVYSKGERYAFTIANRMILPERFMDAKVRLENARWIGATDDVRLTLVTCWPQESNTHRLILVARPIGVSTMETTP